MIYSHFYNGVIFPNQVSGKATSVMYAWLSKKESQHVVTRHWGTVTLAANVPVADAMVEARRGEGPA